MYTTSGIGSPHCCLFSNHTTRLECRYKLGVLSQVGYLARTRDNLVPSNGRCDAIGQYDDSETVWEQVRAQFGHHNGDPGHWNFSPDWYGNVQYNGWGRNAGRVVFEKHSALNGLVQVTSHPVSVSWTEEGEEWRVMRFNRMSRQSVTRVQCRDGTMLPTCLAAEYLKSVASVIASMVGIRNLAVHDGTAPSAQQRVLCIGLGGGSMPMFLHHYFKDMTIDAVEIDPVVLEAAREAMGFVDGQDEHEIRVHVQDACDFVATCGSQYDMIYIDAFDGDDAIPQSFCEESFVSRISDILHPDHGCLIMNFHDNENVMPQAQLFHTRVASQGGLGYASFTTNCRIQKNVILCCSRSPVYATMKDEDAIRDLIGTEASRVGSRFPWRSNGRRATGNEWTLLTSTSPL